MSYRRLIVNLDAVAYLRQARGRGEPDPVTAAAIARLAGSDGVNLQLRGDRRHTQDRDVRLMRQTVERGLSINIEPIPDLLKVVLEVRPDSVVMAPEAPLDVAQHGGLDVAAQLPALAEIVRSLRDSKISCSFLLAADLEQVKAAHRVGAESVRIQTGRFAEDGPARKSEFERISDAARLAVKLGMQVSVGGGLGLSDVRALCEIAAIQEFVVGASLTARAVMLGFERAVGEYREILR